MKHLKLFNQENEYLNVVQHLDRPNVSYVIETDTVYYNSFVETMIVATYNVGYSGEQINLLNEYQEGGGYGYGDPVYIFDINKIEEMYVDGVKLSEPVRYYTFNETGKHEVKYKFYDIENALASDIYRDAPFYWCTSLTKITIPDGVTSIGSEAFAGCSSLTEIAIPDSVTSIGDYAFNGCKDLTEIAIPDGITSIEQATFYGTGLTEIIIPDSVTSIVSVAFRECPSLIKVTIGKSVTSIGRYAFYECPSIRSVYCKPTTPPSLEVGALAASGMKIYVPMESVDTYKTDYDWRGYANFIEGYNF